MSALTAYRTSMAQRLVWTRANLFNTKVNSIVSGVTLLLGLIIGFLIIKFILFDANWGLIALNRKLFFVGSYPTGDLFRIWIAVFLAAVLASVSYGIWAGKLRPYFIVLGIVAFVMLTLGLGTDLYITETPFSQEVVSGGQTSVISGINRDLVFEQGWAPRWLYSLSLGLALPFGTNWLIVAGLMATLAAGALLGKHYLARWKSNQVFMQAVGAAWVLLVPVIVLLQIGVPFAQWESAFLDILIFAVGGFFSFFIGLVLALGRISPLPRYPYGLGRLHRDRPRGSSAGLAAVRHLPQRRARPSRRGVQQHIARLPRDDRVRLLRRGLHSRSHPGRVQSIPRGQYEASEALGLTPLQKYGFIILPQAIKAVIPAIIGRFIALWKDTALLAAISLINTLEKAKKDTRWPDGHRGWRVLRDLHRGRPHLLERFLYVVPARVNC